LGSRHHNLVVYQPVSPVQIQPASRPLFLLLYLPQFLPAAHQVFQPTGLLRSPLGLPRLIQVASHLIVQLASLLEILHGSHRRDHHVRPHASH
jgi:hypothetical protein